MFILLLALLDVRPQVGSSNVNGSGSFRGARWGLQRAAVRAVARPRYCRRLCGGRFGGAFSAEGLLCRVPCI